MPRTEAMFTIQVRIGMDLLEAIDAYAEIFGLTTRSEAVRALLRFSLQDLKTARKTTEPGTENS